MDWRLPSNTSERVKFHEDFKSGIPMILCDANGKLSQIYCVIKKAYRSTCRPLLLGERPVDFCFLYIGREGKYIHTSKLCLSFIHKLRISPLLFLVFFFLFTECKYIQNVLTAIKYPL